MKRIFPKKRKPPKNDKIIRRREKTKRSAMRQQHRLRELRQRQKDIKDARARAIQKEKLEKMLAELERKTFLTPVEPTPAPEPTSSTYPWRYYYAIDSPLTASTSNSTR